MPLTPQITLTGTLGDVFGGADAGAYLQITLIGYGPILPRIAGTAVIAKVGPILQKIANGSFSVTLWGNDVITPSGTYYAIAIVDDKQNVVQSADYLFTGTESVDLSSATPYDPPPPPAPPTNSLYFGIAFNATPIFNIGSTPNAVATFQINLIGNVTFSSFPSTLPGQMVTFIITQDSVGGHSFVWPTNVYNAPSVGSAPLARTVATFVTDGLGNLYAIATGGSSTPTRSVSTVAGTLTGALNGVNETFTITGATPTGSGTLLYNGFTQVYGVDYSVTGNTMTLTFAPISTDVLVYTYPY